METTLNLLTRSGVVYLRFQPGLSAAQSAELLEIAKRANDQDELREMASAWAEAERLTVAFEE